MAQNRPSLISLVCEIFGKKKHRQRCEFVDNVICITLGIKPSYLIDNICVTPGQICLFLTTAVSKQLLPGTLHVLVIESDKFIINAFSLRQYLENSHGNQVLIDVSSTRSAPVFMEDDQSAQLILEMSSLVLHQLEKSLPLECSHTVDISSAQSVVILTLPADMNRSTLFGLMLGYPVLYWYESGVDNCLAMQPLIVCKVRSREHKMGTSHLLYSFSYPEILTEKVNTYVMKWFDKMNGITPSNIELTFEKESVTLPAVCL